MLDEVNFWEAGFLHRNNRSKYGLRAASDQLLFRVNGMSDSEDDYSSYYSYSESESDYSYSDYSDYSYDDENGLTRPKMKIGELPFSDEEFGDEVKILCVRCLVGPELFGGICLRSRNVF